MDFDSMSGDDIIGISEVDFSRYGLNNTKEVWLSLTGEDGSFAGKRGKILLKITELPLTMS